MENKSWTLRYSFERHEIIERLRGKLKQAGREVDTVHGVVSNASVFDAALVALERELDAEITPLRKEVALYEKFTLLDSPLLAVSATLYAKCIALNSII